MISKFGLRIRGFAALREDIPDDVAVDIGEAVITTGVSPGQAGVVDAEKVQDGGMEIVDVYSIFRNCRSNVVSAAKAHAALDAAAGQPG